MPRIPFTAKLSTTQPDDPKAADFLRSIDEYWHAYNLEGFRDSVRVQRDVDRLGRCESAESAECVADPVNLGRYLS